MVVVNGLILRCINRDGGRRRHEQSFCSAQFSKLPDFSDYDLLVLCICIIIQMASLRHCHDLKCGSILLYYFGFGDKPVVYSLNLGLSLNPGFKIRAGKHSQLFHNSFLCQNLGLA